MLTDWNTLWVGTILILVMDAGCLELMFLHKNYIKNLKVFSSSIAKENND